MKHLPYTVRLGLISASLAFGVSCDRDLRPLNPCTVQGNVSKVKSQNIEEVDLLFMVDNSNSMEQEQVLLARELPNLVRVLASGDTDNNGTQEFPPVRSLHVGVVTSDLGTPGSPLCPDIGDDGRMQTAGSMGSCSGFAGGSSFMNFNRGDDSTAFANNAGCILRIGVNGCGIEQQLESTLKALTPSTSSTTFDSDNGRNPRGQGDTANGGFLRDSSLLTIILVTDEEDCSTVPGVDPDFFNAMTGRFSDYPINRRCAELSGDGNLVQPVQRYIDGLLRLRNDPDFLVVAAIAGIPFTLNPAAGDEIMYDQILAHPDMQHRASASMPNFAGTSCSYTDNTGAVSTAFPPRRIVETLRGVEAGGGNVVLQSICQDSFAGALAAVTRKIADVLGGTCLPRELIRSQTGTVNCDVVEVLPIGRTCEEFPGRVFRETETDQNAGVHQVCTVNQLVANGSEPSGEGWYYDDFSASAMMCPDGRQQRLSFKTAPSAGTVVRLECLQRVSDPGTGGGIRLGSQCGAGGSCAGAPEYPGFPRGLGCMQATNTCEPVCETASDCEGGYACASGFCVNPTCAE